MIENSNNQRKLVVAMFLVSIFMAAEAIGGLLSNSLALLADSCHMLSDFFALALSWASYRYSNKPADEKRSYGYRRLHTVVALVNSIALFMIAAVITVEAIQRFWSNAAVDWKMMLPIAVLGLVANGLIYITLSPGHHKSDLNMRSALIHVLGDFFASLSTVIGALIISQTGWTKVDPILSLLVAAMLCKTGTTIVREAIHVLLEGAPNGLSTAHLREKVCGKFGIVDVHHMHLWCLSEDYTIMTMHIVLGITPIEAGFDSQSDLLKELKQYLREQLNIRHATIEVETTTMKCSDSEYD